jgi:hypothetical protein
LGEGLYGRARALGEALREARPDWGKWPIYRVVPALIMVATAVNPMASGTPPASLKRSYTRAVNMGAPLDILGR